MSSVFYEKFIAGKDKPIMSSGADKDWNEKTETFDVYIKEQTALDKQVGGNHYAAMKIQPVEFITANGLTFLEGNVVKYISRHHAKNGADDVKKAIHYCELILKTVYGQ